MKTTRIALLAGIAACACAANAQLTVYMSDSLGHVLTVINGGAGDISGQTNSVIIDPKLLLATFPELDPTSMVSASENIGTGDPYRYVSTNVLFKQFGPNGGITQLFVQAGDTGFAVPFSDPKLLSAAYSGNYANATTASTSLFLGEADPINNLFGQTVQTNGLLGNSTGVTPNAFSSSTAGPTFSTNGGLYSMTAYGVYDLESDAVLQATGIVTTTAAVPEPASFAILGCGIVGIVRLRRKGR